MNRTCIHGETRPHYTNETVPASNLRSAVRKAVWCPGPAVVYTDTCSTHSVTVIDDHMVSECYTEANWDEIRSIAALGFGEFFTTRDGLEAFFMYGWVNRSYFVGVRPPEYDRKRS